jgi:hypothetical protein
MAKSKKVQLDSILLHKLDAGMQKLEEIHLDVKKINEEKIPKLDKRIAVVETKTTIYGGLAGLVGGFLAMFTQKHTGI